MTQKKWLNAACAHKRSNVQVLGWNMEKNSARFGEKKWRMCEKRQVQNVSFFRISLIEIGREFNCSTSWFRIVFAFSHKLVNIIHIRFASRHKWIPPVCASIHRIRLPHSLSLCLCLSHLRAAPRERERRLRRCDCTFDASHSIYINFQWFGIPKMCSQCCARCTWIGLHQPDCTPVTIPINFDSNSDRRANVLHRQNMPSQRYTSIVRLFARCSWLSLSESEPCNANAVPAATHKSHIPNDEKCQFIRYLWENWNASRARERARAPPDPNV